MAERDVLLKPAAYGAIPSEAAEADDITPYGPTIALAMALNYIIGTGCFGLPYAFKEAGIVLTATLLIVGIVASVISMNYTLEALARAEGVSSASRGRGPMHRLTFRKFDFTTIGDIFAGQLGKVVVQTVVVLYGLGALWSYASVFSSSVASLFYEYVLQDHCDVYASTVAAGCNSAYYVCMLVFAVIVLAMVLMDLHEQAGIQKFLSAYRVIALFLMLVTMLTKLSVDGRVMFEQRYNTVGAFNWREFGKGFGPTLLALNCQYNMPDALQPLKPKTAARRVSFGAIWIAGIFYLLLGVLGALAFDNINPLATLMWQGYSGCGNGWTPCSSTNPVGTLVQVIILLFPVVNVASAYPMVGVTIGDNLLTTLPPAVAAPFRCVSPRTFCRLLAAVPPLVLAFAFKKLDYIFSIAGLFGFLLGLSIPCWFQVVGTRYCQRVWGFPGASVTPYTRSIISSVPFAGTFLVLTFGILGIAIATLGW